jgi:guanosine-3',5'-bis(diphosphate) 3'-pyrophosphohydrolase
MPQTQLEGCEQIIEEGGDHSFRGIERHVGRIKQFFADADGVLEQFLSSAENTDIQNFLRTIDLDDLVKAFSILDEACKERIMENLSTRTQKSLLEEVEYASENITIDELKKSFKNLRHYAKKVMGENPFVQRSALGWKHFGLCPDLLTQYEIDALLEVYESFNADRIIEVITFAAKAHGAQMTPMGFPYLHHLMSVATHVMAGTQKDGFSIEDQENAIIAALLHDTIEDTAIEYTDIQEAFGESIADAVSALTKNKLVGEKQAQMEDSLSRIKAQPRWVWCVKMADRITNLTGVPEHWDEAKKQKYLSEARVLWSALHAASEDLSERLLRKIERYE